LGVSYLDYESKTRCLNTNTSLFERGHLNAKGKHICAANERCLGIGNCKRTLNGRALFPSPERLRGQIFLAVEIG
jgi:hypothetical protein